MIATLAVTAMMTFMFGGLWLVRNWSLQSKPGGGEWWRRSPHPQGEPEPAAPEAAPAPETVAEPAVVRQPRAQVRAALTEDEVISFGLALETTRDVIGELLAEDDRTGGTGRG